jgi:dienelactone hydrolase
MTTRPIETLHGGVRLEGTLVAASAEQRPTVLIFPTIMGRSELEMGFARRLVADGYTAILADLYGERGLPREHCRALMNALLADRTLLRDRLLTVLGTAQAQPEVGPVAAIGFCFGGLCALDLARSGADVAGVASFHGLLSPSGLAPEPIAAKVIVFHGWDDPMAPPAHVEALAAELSAAAADWQLHAYGKVMHGFTNPKAAAPASGILYDEQAARRSWATLGQFLKECFEE